MWVNPTVTASTMITHVRGAAQGQMSHAGAVETFGNRDALCVVVPATDGDFRLTHISSRLILPA
jgi:hypothetical protein